MFALRGITKGLAHRTVKNSLSNGPKRLFSQNNLDEHQVRSICQDMIDKQLTRNKLDIEYHESYRNMVRSGEKANHDIKQLETMVCAVWGFCGAVGVYLALEESKRS